MPRVFSEQQKNSSREPCPHIAGKTSMLSTLLRDSGDIMVTKMCAQPL